MTNIRFIEVLRFRVLDAGPALPPGYKRGEPSSSSDESEEVTVKRVKTSEDKDTEYVDRTITRQKWNKNTVVVSVV